MNFLIGLIISAYAIIVIDRPNKYASGANTA